MKTAYDIDITLNDERWNSAIPDIQNFTSDLIERILSGLTKTVEHIEISIVLADNAFVQELNKTYRHKDKPTNVLSFPQTEKVGLKAASPFISLGDIIIAYETIQQEALDQGKAIKDHYTHMLTHGCLHLLHYDHQTDEDAQNMESIEINILKDLGIKNPYETL